MKINNEKLKVKKCYLNDVLIAKNLLELTRERLGLESLILSQFLGLVVFSKFLDIHFFSLDQSIDKGWDDTSWILDKGCLTRLVLIRHSDDSPLVCESRGSRFAIFDLNLKRFFKNIFLVFQNKIKITF